MISAEPAAGDAAPDPALVRRLERATQLAWPPQETAGCAGWLLRWSADVSHRTNSAVTLDFPTDGHLDRAIDEVTRWYAARGRPACFQLTDLAAPHGLDRRLEAAGYDLLTPSLVLTRPLGEPVPRHSLPPGMAIDLARQATPAAIQATYDPGWDAAARAARGALFARIAHPLAFCVAREGGTPVAGALAVLVEDLAVISAMRTQPAHRGRGLAAAVLGRLLGWACAMGAKESVLQVEAGNAAAMALYRGAGFGRRYRYWYREQGRAGSQATVKPA